ANATAPWPQETNRRLTDAIADKLFAPTLTAAEALRREGVPDRNVFVTGATGIDALLLLRRRLATDGALLARVAAPFAALDGARSLVLVAGYRNEVPGSGAERIGAALARIAGRDDAQ